MYFPLLLYNADKDDPKEFYEMQQQIHMQSQAHMRNIDVHHHASNSPSRLLSIHSSQVHQLQSGAVPTLHQAQKIHHSQSAVSTPQAQQQQPSQQQNQSNGYSHHPQSNGESRPSVIESNQALIIECT